MNHFSLIPTCAACGGRIGIYELLWHESAAGGVPVRTSLLNIDPDPDGAHRPARLYHLDCLEAAAA